MQSRSNTVFSLKIRRPLGQGVLDLSLQSPIAPVLLPGVFYLVTVRARLALGTYLDKVQRPGVQKLVKTGPKASPKMDPILDQFWSQFWPENGPQNCLKIGQKIDHFGVHF